MQPLILPWYLFWLWGWRLRVWQSSVFDFMAVNKYLEFVSNIFDLGFVNHFCTDELFCNVGPSDLQSHILVFYQMARHKLNNCLWIGKLTWISINPFHVLRLPYHRTLYKLKGTVTWLSLFSLWTLHIVQFYFTIGCEIAI